MLLYIYCYPVAFLHQLDESILIPSRRKHLSVEYAWTNKILTKNILVYLVYDVYDSLLGSTKWWANILVCVSNTKWLVADGCKLPGAGEGAAISPHVRVAILLGSGFYSRQVVMKRDNLKVSRFLEVFWWKETLIIRLQGSFGVLSVYTFKWLGQHSFKRWNLA